MRDAARAAVVLETLRFFDEDRYFLTDVVVMPNHVHFIAAFASDEAMLKQCSGWKRFSSKKLNELEGRYGEFWQVDQFDHLIRGESQFEYFRDYIRDNPVKSGLREGDYAWWRKELEA